MRFLPILPLLFCVSAPALAQPKPAARQLVEQALAAQGGAQPLRDLRSVRLHAMVHRNSLEQSLRPEGPWFENFGDEVQTRRFDSPALRVRGRNRGFLATWWADKPDWASETTLVTGGAALELAGDAWVPASQASVELAEESLALGPERALLTALAAPDLVVAPQVMLNGYRVDRLRFRWNGAPVSLYLQPQSHMPLAVEVVRHRIFDLYLNPWGDVKTRVEWGGWTVEAGGVRYPRLWNVTINGQVERTVMIDQVELNPVIDAATLAAPEAVLAKAKAARRPAAAIGFSTSRSVDVAPGVTLVQGAWNVVKVVQPGGVYVIEGPISNEFSAGAIAYATAGGRKLLGVISTSDSWPHIGGLREYVSRGVPITALDLNLPILKRLFASPHLEVPDALARKPVRAQITSVAAPVTIGSGTQAMRVIPLRTATGERQMAIYWPAHRLLYTSDILTAKDGTLWLPQYRDEIASVIEREKLDVETVFGMHYVPVKWTELRTMRTWESN